MHKALVLDRQAGTIALQLCRALARLNYRVEVFGERESIAFRSRYCARALVAPAWQPYRVASELRRIIEQDRYAVIYVCSEEILEILHNLLSATELTGLPLSKKRVVEVLLSKNVTVQHMKRAGIAVPITIVPDGEDEVKQASSELGVPLVVKGERGDSGRNVEFVTSPEDVLPAYRRIAQREQSYGGRPSLQEMIRGQSYSVGGLFREGRALRICAHKKVLTYPPFGGFTVKGVTSRPPGLLDESMRVFDAFGYTGLGHVEFIQDIRDGRYKFIELNPRVWGSIGLAEHAGVDLFAPYNALAQGESVAPDLNYREGVTYHRFSGEIRLILRQPSRLPGFLRDALDPRIRSDFTWSDAGPHLFSLTLASVLNH